MERTCPLIAGVGLAERGRKSAWPARLDLTPSATGLKAKLAGEGDFYELIGDDSGVFGCMSLLACHDVCPKNLPLSTQIAFMRRKMAVIGWSGR